MKIRIEGPSSPFKAEALARGIELLRARGHEVVVGVGRSDGGVDAANALRGSHPYLNGDDDVRRRGLEGALASDADVVWLARGGYGLTRIVDDVALPAGPLPVVVGFSDATALFGRLARAGHLDRCVHGPLATTIAGEDEVGIARALDVVTRCVARRVAHAPASPTPPPLPPLRTIQGVSLGTDRVVEGPLWAGNLVVLAALCGTPSMPDLAGHIVVVEEVGERPYRLDRVLTQLLRAGAFRDVAGIVVGHLTGCDEPTSSAPSMRDPVPRGIDVVIERLESLGVPIVAGLPSGHEAPNLALPLGGRARLVVDGATAQLVADG